MLAVRVGLVRQFGLVIQRQPHPQQALIPSGRPSEVLLRFERKPLKSAHRGDGLGSRKGRRRSTPCGGRGRAGAFFKKNALAWVEGFLPSGQRASASLDVTNAERCSHPSSAFVVGKKFQYFVLTDAYFEKHVCNLAQHFRRISSGRVFAYRMTCSILGA